jgi:hypothetical protein
MILDKTLNEWVEQHGQHAKGQVGLRKDYYTTDQLFIFRILIEEQGKKEATLLLFCGFVKGIRYCVA